MPDLSLPVLLVDDYASMRRTVRSMLQHIGFTSIAEDDGSGALPLIQDQSFGLIISDLMMKPVNGLELLRKVRGHPRTSATLFVMITGAAHQDLVLAARDLKVDEYLVKPFDANTLKRKLFALLERAGGAPAQKSPAPRAEVSAGDSEKENAEVAVIKRAIEALYASLDARLRAGESVPHDDLVSLIRVYIDRAVAQGVEPHYRQQIEAMLANLPAAKPSEDSGLSGRLHRIGEPARGAMPILDRRRDSGTRPDERRSGQESRRYKRFIQPALDVTIDERKYRTRDWSIGGLTIWGYFGDLRPGRQIEITLQVEGRGEEARVFSDHTVVVRTEAGAGSLALRFISPFSATFKVLEYLTRRREAPVEATRAPAAAPSSA